MRLKYLFVFVMVFGFVLTACAAEPEEDIILEYIMIRGTQLSTEKTSLFFSHADLTDEEIVPLRYMTNLTELWLDSNRISDITPLAGLSNLTRLGLSVNQISDITPLTDLRNLTSLYLSFNQISDITPLAELTNLTVLSLTHNQLSDITPLAAMTDLTQLNLGRNQISDIMPLADLTNLSRLDLSYNRVSDIMPLSNLTNLRRLFLNNNPVHDRTPLAGLTNLLPDRIEIDRSAGDIVWDSCKIENMTYAQLLGLLALNDFLCYEIYREIHETENNLQYILYTAQYLGGVSELGFTYPSQISLIREVRTVERASGVIIQTEQDVLKEILGHVEDFRNIFRVW